MTSGKATIGVLGGMGPEATILFMQKIVDAVRANDDSDHVPLIVHNNTQVPSRINALIGEAGSEPGPGPVLAEMAQSLEKAGAAALAMPCNTAHCYAPAVVDAVSIPFLDMVALAADRASALAGPGARVGVLGSPALEQTGIFRRPLERAGLTPVHGRDGDPRLTLIRSVKRHGVSPDAIDALQGAADHLEACGVDLMMVCCTEFSLMAQKLRTAIPLFDTIDSLVDACVAFSTGKSPPSEVAHRSSAASAPLQIDQLGKENLQC